MEINEIKKRKVSYDEWEKMLYTRVLLKKMKMTKISHETEKSNIKINPKN